MEYVEETTKKEEKDVKRTKVADVEGEMMETRDLKHCHVSCQEDLQKSKRQKSETPMRKVASSSRERSSARGDGHRNGLRKRGASKAS